LIWGLTAAQAPAQEGTRLALHSINGPNNSYGPACTGEPPQAAGPWYPGRCLVRGAHKCACWASIYTLGCGSLKQECTFIFGGCRSFYGEPCLNGPPVPVAPPGAPGAYYPPPGCPHCPP
jgi:hypothetical protein